jgi:diguanylate cyclase (GGDEF)-like protein/PAS domain S-box-containing protein
MPPDAIKETSMPGSRDKPEDLKVLNNSQIHKVLLDELYDAVYFVDTERRIQYWNRAAASLSGYAEGEVLGRHCYDDLLCHTDDAGKLLCHNACPLQKCMETRERCKGDVYLRHKHGHRISVSVRVTPITDGEGKVIGALEVFLDNSSKKNLQRRTDELRRIAYVDSLTGLVNRRYLEMRLGQAHEEFSLFKSPFGLLLIDIDHFKKVNDSCGHAGGDIALAHIAQMLSNNLRATDTIGRWGGEEFVALLPNADPMLTRVLADRCRMLVESSSLVIDGKKVHPTISIGATSFEVGDDPATILARADSAMYQSKSEGRNRVTMSSWCPQRNDAENLSRRPLEVAPTQQVEVEMEDRLA